jgi:hypothetical protein
MLSEGSSLAGLEAGARDVIGRVLSNPDVQNVGDSIRSGALRVSCRFCVFCFFSPVDLWAERGRGVRRVWLPPAWMGRGLAEEAWMYT